MTLIKSVLLGSAATLMVVAGAQAADLPTKKGAPAAEYVKVCKIGSFAGFIIPGTDTCLKLSGFVTSRYAAGTTHDVYTFDSPTSKLYKSVAARQQDGYGDWTRFRLIVETMTNTAYGPLYTMAMPEMEFGHGYIAGYNSVGAPNSQLHDNASMDKAWITWAGITAGKHESMFDNPDLDGAVNSDMDIFAPDVSTDLLAYTATFGGGFSATISMESQQGSAGTLNNFGGDMVSTTLDGGRAPDFVAALDVKQGWGDAHLAGIMHEIRQQYTGSGTGASPEATKSTWGYGVNGGVTINLPSLGAGADFKVNGAYTEGYYAQSGVTSPWYLNLGGVANNGAQGDIIYDAATNTWKKPEIYTVAGGFDFPIGPTFKVSPEASYAHVHLSMDDPDTYMSKNWQAFLGGATFEWTPVHGLVFDLDLLYENGRQDTPAAWNSAATANGEWKKNFCGFIGELRVERDF